jgi:hypothetical protein
VIVLRYGDWGGTRKLGWLGPIVLGTGIGLGVVTVGRLGAWSATAQALGSVAEALHRVVGPVWIPMFLVSLRVGWVSGRALRTRFGRGPLGVPVRPELGQLAPLFAALGLCGTVWGLIIAFEALEDGEFLSRLPVLLGGLGAAMTSTLVGLGLQITTLLLGVINPAWSWASVGWEKGEPRFELDGRILDTDAHDAARLAESIRARQPEALFVAFDRAVPMRVRERLLDSLWRGLDSAIPIRTVQR